jgi:hypothetical protein
MMSIHKLKHRSLGSGMTVALGLMAILCVPPAVADDDVLQVINGEAILQHPASQPILEAASLLRAGKLAEVKMKSVKEVRDEWAAMSAAEQSEEISRNTDRAPDPAVFEADIARVGVLRIYEGVSAQLSIPTPDGTPSAMAFVALEDGEWKVTGGPMTFQPPPVETAPAIVGAAILDHPIGPLAVEYAKRLASGDVETANELLSRATRAMRAALPAAERAKSDLALRSYLPPASTFSDQIRSGGTLSFFGDRAVLNVSSNETTQNADGSTTYTSNSTGLGFALEDGEWRISDD